MVINGLRVDTHGRVVAVDLAELARAVEWRSRIARSVLPISDEADHPPECCSACGAPTDDADGRRCIVC